MRIKKEQYIVLFFCVLCYTYYNRSDAYEESTIFYNEFFDVC